MKKKLVWNMGATLGLALLLAPAAQAGLIGEWTFNETSGATAYDSSGNGNHATITGAGRVSTDGLRGVSLDGIDDWVNMGTSALFDIHGHSARISLVAWVSLPLDGNPDSEVPVFGKSTSNLGYSLTVNTANDMYFAYPVGNPQTLASTSDKLVVSTYHADGAASPNGRSKIYIDGSFITQGDIIDAQSNPNSPLRVGCNGVTDCPPGNAEHFLTGVWDEVAIYDHVLDQGEIDALWAAGPSTAPIPEPASIALIGLGLAVMGLRRRR